MTQRSNIIVSIIIPCYCSEAYLRKTVFGIIYEFSAHPNYECELILINDGSSDNTFEVIRSLCKQYPNITGITLTSNSGQIRAKLAGIRFISGSYAVFMDDDGQHDPSAIFSMISKADEGFNIVYAAFPTLKESRFRRCASFLNDRILSLVSGKPKNVKITSYFVIDQVSIERLKSMETYAGSIGQCLFSRSCKVTSVQVEHQNRTEGQTNYTFKKLFAAWIRLLLSNGRKQRITPGEIDEVISYHNT